MKVAAVDPPPTAPLTLGTLTDLLGRDFHPMDVAIAIMKAYTKMVPARCYTCRRKLVALLHCREDRPRQAAGPTGDGWYGNCDDCVERAPARRALLRVLRSKAGPAPVA